MNMIKARNVVLAGWMLGAALFGAAPVEADYQVIDGTTHLIPFKAFACTTGFGTGVCPGYVPMDASGNAFGVPGNPFFVNCSNCGGGGGGVSATFGGAIGSSGVPGGFKDASGNFQPLLGDTSFGQWVNIKSSVSIPVTGTFFQATQPVSAASLPLPTGAATQTTSAATLTALGSPFQAGGSIGNTSFAATQATAANLNATVVGTGTFATQLTGTTNNINNIAGTISLPTGAATSALQTTGNTSLSTIATNSGAQATAANQATANASLATIATNTGAAIPAGSAIIGKVSLDQTTPGTTNNVAASVNGVLTNPTSTLTLTATTTAYTAGQLIANSATAGSVVNPSFVIANSAGGAVISRLRLSTNDTTATAWGAQTIQVDLWTVTPTWTNGDRGTWSPATGTGSHLAAFTCLMSAEFGDGAYAECAPTVGTFASVKLPSGTSIFWSLQAVSGSGVTGASNAFTVAAEVLN